MGTFCRKKINIKKKICANAPLVSVCKELAWVMLLYSFCFQPQKDKTSFFFCMTV